MKDRTDHPTAESVYTSVKKDFPNISLGTVYRNLMLMRDTGKLNTVDVGDGVIHFDPNTSEHSHFVCTDCGRIIDLPGVDMAAIKAGAQMKFRGKIEGCQTCFYGLCEDCMKKKSEGRDQVLQQIS